MKKGSSLEFLLKRRDRAVSRCVNADDKESSWVINSIFFSDDRTCGEQQYVVLSEVSVRSSSGRDGKADKEARYDDVVIDEIDEIMSTIIRSSVVVLASLCPFLPFAQSHSFYVSTILKYN